MQKPPVTILLVDDDPLIRGLGQELLEHLGYRVAAAANGPEALDLFGRLPMVDLVILDYYLPGENGLEVLEQLKVLDPEVKVLIASGSFHPQEVPRLKEAGAVGLIYKPYRVAELESRIRAVLAGLPGF